MLKPKKIVLVEDNQADVRLVRYALDKCHYDGELVVFEDGEQLLAFIEKDDLSNVGFILMDLNMKAISGFDVLEEVRQMRNHPILNTPIVVFSSSHYQKDIEQCYALGANAYVKKPLELDDFVRSIEHILAFWLDTNQQLSA